MTHYDTYKNISKIPKNPIKIPHKVCQKLK